MCTQEFLGGNVKFHTMLGILMIDCCCPSNLTFPPNAIFGKDIFLDKDKEDDEETYNGSSSAVWFEPKNYMGADASIR